MLMHRLLWFLVNKLYTKSVTSGYEVQSGLASVPVT